VAGAAAAFSFSLSGAGVALPLLALARGYGGAAIGVFTALSAVAQMGTRSVLGLALSRFPDRLLVIVAAVLMALSNLIVGLSAAVLPFVVAELLQGAARGGFWTGSQSHVVRYAGPAVRPLAIVNLVSSAGLLAGPVVAGAVAEHDLRAALWISAALGALAAVIAARMTPHPPYRPRPRRGGDRLWRQPAVAVACWAGVSMGAWRGLLSSFVPVVLSRAGQSASTIGALVAVANAASLGGAGGVGRLNVRATTGVLVAGTAATGLATAAAALVAGQPVSAGLALAISGVSAGALQTLGPALAAESVHPEERGMAIATAGTFRAAALLAAPLAVAGLVLVMPTAAGLAVAGVLASTPAVVTFAVRRAAAQ
jgi:MFS family permease